MNIKNFFLSLSLFRTMASRTLSLSVTTPCYSNKPEKVYEENFQIFFSSSASIISFFCRKERERESEPYKWASHTKKESEWASFSRNKHENLVMFNTHSQRVTIVVLTFHYNGAFMCMNEKAKKINALQRKKADRSIFLSPLLLL